MTCTIFKNIFSKEPHYIPVKDALTRIQTGRSRILVEEIRATLDKEKAGKAKCNLPSVCFSGTFGKDRKDDSLMEHSGFIVLDFDNVEDLRNTQTEIISSPFVFACWVSPSGLGLKALIKLSTPEKHRQHFAALQEEFPAIDKSGVNPSRVCYESWDPDIYINESAKLFNKLKVVEKVQEITRTNDEQKIFTNLLTWLSNKQEAFVTGDRNNFIFKLAGACCRFGLPENSTLSLISYQFLITSDFSREEATNAVRSAYRSNNAKSGQCSFENEKLVDRISRKEVKVSEITFDSDAKPKDVIYGVDVKDRAMAIYDNGYEKVNGIGVQAFDERFKMKRGEITLLSGFGNHGKSSFLKWYLLMRVILYGEKFASFSPEDNPSEEYYHDFVEIMLGCDCTPYNSARPSRDAYEQAYDFITKHIFYVYPKDLTPTPEYIKERFLELIIKEKVDGLIIDPFNQLSNDYGRTGRTDKYLETLLGDFSRYAQANSVYFLIIAHPTKGHKDTTGNYPCPDVFDIADGAMWNNKMDNILIYHRPFHSTQPDNPTCEMHSKKIRRQKTVGKRGFLLFEMFFQKRRFFIDGSDSLQKALNEKGIQWAAQPSTATPQTRIWDPYKDNNDITDETPF